MAGFLLAQFEHNTPASDRLEPWLTEGSGLAPEALREWCRQAQPDAILVASNLLQWPMAAMPPGVALVTLGLESPAPGPLAGVWGCESRVGALAVEQVVDALNRNQTGP